MSVNMPKSIEAEMPQGSGEKPEASNEPINSSEGDSSQISSHIENYVVNLSEQMVFSPENVGRFGVSGIPTPEKMASLVIKKPDSLETRLNIPPWGPRSSFSISSNTEITKDTANIRSQVALLLEAAARNRVVAKKLVENDPVSAVIRMAAKARAAKFKKVAEKFILEPWRAKSKPKRLLESSVLTLALAACSTTAIATSETDNNQPGIETSIELPTPTPEPTDVGVPTPESLTRQESQLILAGYTIQATPEGIQLVNREGLAVLSSTEPQMIKISTQSGEKEFSQNTFVVRETIGAGVENILTIQSQQGEVEYFFLDRTNEWVTPIEQQTNPKEIENYPQIDINDIWNGRALYSELLSAEPFPEGTLVPDQLAYTLWRTGGGGYLVKIQHLVDGNYDTQLAFYRDLIRQNNDYQRWIAFYRSQTPDGIDVLIGTEQILSTDGETSIFLHYIFGPEWPWEDDYRFPSGRTLNLIDNVFQATDPSVSDPNNELGRVIRPVITVVYEDPELAGRGIQILPGGAENNPPAAGGNLYLNFNQNNPVNVREDLAQLISNAAETTGPTVYVSAVGSEIEDMQYIALMGTLNHVITPEYFQNN